MDGECEACTLTETLRQGIAPATVYLTHARSVAHQSHPFLAAEDDASAQPCTGLYIFQPTIEQQPGVSAVYFCQMEWPMQSTATGLNDCQTSSLFEYSRVII